MTMMVCMAGPDGTTVRLDPSYHLRFFFPRLLHEALSGLEKEGAWEDWYADILKEAGVTVEELLEGWRSLGRYMECCLDETKTNVRESVEACGFLACRKEVRLVVLAKMGQLLTASLWWPLRDGTHLGDKPADVIFTAERAASVADRLLFSSTTESKKE